MLLQILQDFSVRNVKAGVTLESASTGPEASVGQLTVMATVRKKALDRKQAKQESSAAAECRSPVRS
jgi:hypothetical protein